MVEVSELLEEKVAMLRRLTKEYEVNLAIGYCWNDQNASAVNIRMAKAESAMYQEKVHTIKQRGWNTDSVPSLFSFISFILFSSMIL